MLYGIATIGGTETAVKVHLMDDKEDCSRLIRPSQWNFFRSCFSHIGIEPGRVMVVSQEEYERVAGSRTRKREIEHDQEESAASSCRCDQADILAPDALGRGCGSA